MPRAALRLARILPMFTPLRVREMTLHNRVVVAPMDMYSAVDGTPNDFHLVHLGARALGGAGLVMTEMVCVSPEGRITPGCTGMWTDEQAAAWRRIPVDGRWRLRSGALLAAAAALEREAPVLEPRPRRRPRRQHGEVGGDVLARRDPRRCGGVRAAPPPPEPAREGWVAHGLRLHGSIRPAGASHTRSSATWARASSRFPAVHDR